MSKDGLTYKKGGHYELPNGEVIKGRVPAEKALQELKLKNVLQSAMTGRQEITRRAGVGYKGERDIYTVAGYTQPGKEDFELFWGLYERNEIAGRIIDMPPKTTWKTPPELVEPDRESDEPTPFMEEVLALADRLRLWNRLERGDRLARIGRYGVILIGVPGDDKDLVNEMTALRGPEDILYLSAYHEKEARISTFVTDPGNSRFGLPLLYDIEISNGEAGKGKQTLKVHWSRVIHIAEDVLGDDTYGRPILKRLLNRLFDLDKVTASTAEAFWQLATRILVGSVDSDSDMDDTKFKELGDNLQEVVHDLRRQFLGQGVDLKWLESTPPEPGGAADLYMMLVAAGAGIPKRVLFGTETGERASEQDERQWLGTINERQEQHAEPNILRAFLDRMIQYKGLTAPGKDGYDIIWPTLFEETESAKAEANVKRSEAAKNLTPIGGNPLDFVEIDENRDVWLKTTKQMEEERLLEEEEDEEMEPEPLPEGGIDDGAPPEALEAPAEGDDEDPLPVEEVGEEA